MALGSLLIAAATSIALDRWIAAAPIPDLTLETSATLLDREGRLLAAWQVADGRWRLPVTTDDVDPAYIDQLLAYEDRRFFDHSGVDLLAMMRAAGQAVINGRAVSGASTLTMQVARLLQERPTRSIGAKLDQIRLALALERRLDKQQILNLYLTLAPFGGNIEGVRAASLTWFGKEPRRLTPAQAALLVALPQAPNARRPDRYSDAATQARSRVLARAVDKTVLTAEEAAAARTEALPRTRRPFPHLAPHLAARLRASGDAARATIDRTLQASLEALVANRVRTLPSSASAAIIIADHGTGEILASVGSPGLIDGPRQGYVDMTRAIRSPGSTLKPLIYGLAFEAGLAHPESLVEDRPTSFAGYVPTNFDDGYHGTVSVRAALQRSLNVPAVALLDGVGPAQLLSRMRRAGMETALPPGKAPGLAIGLGGIGTRLTDLVALYAAIARGGEAIVLRATPGSPETGRRVLSAGAAWHVTDILAGAAAPNAAANDQLAFKTGTSYGYRDAWAVGYDGAHVIGVWVGRADAAPLPGRTGINTAAPILFEAFSRLKEEPVPFAPPPKDVLIVGNAGLPAPLRQVRKPHGPRKTGPEIAFPPNGARVDRTGGLLALKVRDGRPPFTWLVDGQPIETLSLDREITWRPEGPGFVAISVVDAAGQAARSDIFLK
ncbi:MAG: penicillin-binding protein 1C [Pseudomonadota bacterium]